MLVNAALCRCRQGLFTLLRSAHPAQAEITAQGQEYTYCQGQGNIDGTGIEAMFKEFTGVVPEYEHPYEELYIKYFFLIVIAHGY